MVACVSQASPERLASDTSAVPQRVVSLDYCADQFVLKLLPEARILAVSPDAVKAFSYMGQSAIGRPTVRPMAEDVLLLQPDLVVRSYGGGSHAVQFFKRAGISVLQLDYADSIADIKTSIRHISRVLGVKQVGMNLVAEMDARLARLSAANNEQTRPSLLYITPAGVTAGPGTIIHAMIKAAGMRNFQTSPGWQSLPLERLAYERPDIIATAFYEITTNFYDVWSVSRHPLVLKQFQDLPVIAMGGAVTVCGGWFVLDAIEAIWHEGKKLE